MFLRQHYLLLHPMKLFISIIAGLFLATGAFAQEAEEQEYRNGIIPVSNYNPDVPNAADSLHLPMVDNSGRVMTYPHWHNPFWGGGFWGWDLHEGLNVNIGASVSASFGNGHTTTGIGQNIAVMYADAVNSKFSYAVGGYMNNYSFGNSSFREGGISAMLNYRFNDKLEGYAYVQKNITSNYSRMGFVHPMAMPYYDMANIGDRIGGGLRYQINDHSSIQFNFEYSRIPADAARGMMRNWCYPGAAFYHPYGFGYPYWY